MNQKNPELGVQQHPLLMLEDLATRHGVVPDEKGASDFEVGSGVRVTIYGKDGSPHRGSEGCLANLVGALRQGETERTVQVMPDGLRGWTHSLTDEGTSDRMDGKDCAEWYKEVCAYEPQSIAA